MQYKIIIALCILFPVSVSNSMERIRGEAKQQSCPGSEMLKLRFGVEYLIPTDTDRNIKTININGYFLLFEIDNLNMRFYTGVTGSYATGEITQLEGELEEGTLREVNFNNTAFGIGPSLLVDVGFFYIQNFSFHLNGSGSFVFYNKDFPAGGDRYNFMWRAGPVIEYKLNDDQKIGISYQWAHVSNGQGFGPQNPSYDAQGPGIFLSGSF